MALGELLVANDLNESDDLLGILREVLVGYDKVHEVKLVLLRRVIAKASTLHKP